MLISHWKLLISVIFLVSFDASTTKYEYLQEEYLLPGELYRGRFQIERIITQYPRLMIFEAFDLRNEGSRKLLSIHPYKGAALEEEERLKTINKTISVVQKISKNVIEHHKAYFKAVEEYFIDENDKVLVEVMDGNHYDVESVINRENKSESFFFFLLKDICHTEEYLRTAHQLIVPFIATENIKIITKEGIRGLRTIHPVLLGPEYQEEITKSDHLIASRATLEVLLSLIVTFKERNNTSTVMNEFFNYILECYRRGRPTDAKKWRYFELRILAHQNNVPTAHISRL